MTLLLRAGDTLSGQEGKATATIDGNVQDLFFLKSVEASFEKTKTDVKAIGKRGVQQKSAGWAGKGTLSIYYMTTIFRKMALKYAKTGKDIYFTLTVVNDDPGSTVGLQTVALYNCNIDKVILAKLDTESDVLDEDIDFTFDDFDILDEFGKPII